MRFILSKSTNIYFNLAQEEYLLKNFNENFFILWQSSPSMVLGKHQNAFAEINFPYVNRNNVSIARRISGGGTVYHDLGNLNFTFISNGETGKLVDFKKQVEPIVTVLSEMGINARLGARNNIFIGDKKISGNAEHIFKLRVLHHGTLLFNTDLNMLMSTLKINKQKFIDKSIPSVSATVTNIRDHLPKKISINQFITELANKLKKYYPDAVNVEMSLNDIEKIKQLANEKYATEEWIYGYSPKYVFNNTIELHGKKIPFELRVAKGIIEDVISPNEILNSSLTGVRHEFSAIKNILLAKKITGSENIDPVTYSFFY